MRKKKVLSEARKHYERLMTKKFWEIVEGKDPYYDQEFYQQNSVEAMTVELAIHWDEARALVNALENSYLDDDYTPEQSYELRHLMDGMSQNRARMIGEDADKIIISYKTRAEILTRLSKISKLDFGDDPDEWRSWFEAFENDDFFPPTRGNI